MNRRLSALALLLAAGCARSEDAASIQLGNETPPALNASEEGEEDEIAIGDWRMGLQDDQPILEFGPSGAAPVFSLGCDARRNLLLQRHGAAASGDLPTMMLSVGSENRRLAVANTGTAIPMLRAVLPPNDPFRNVLTAAAAPIVIRIGDAPPLVLPHNPQIGTYAGQCANGEARATTAAGNSLEADVTTTANINAPMPPGNGN